MNPIEKWRKRNQRHEPVLTTPPTHPPSAFRQGAVYFTFATSLERPTDVRRAARDLMKCGLAEAAAFPGHPVRIAPNFASLASTKGDAERLAAYVEAIDSGTSLRALWRIDRRLLTSNLLTIAKSRFRRHAEADSVDEESDAASSEDIKKSMKDVADEITTKVADLQVAGGLRSAIDAELLSPHYLEDESYLRLQLRPVYLRTIASPTDEDLKESPIWLTLHRSGVMLITLAIPFWDQVDTDKLLDLSVSKNATIFAAKISEPALLGSGITQGNREPWERWGEEIEAGTNWLTTHPADPFDVASVFQTYRDAVATALGEDASDPWFCYASTFVSAQSCCSTKAEWKVRHAVELTALNTRSARYALAMSEPHPLSEDLSLDETLLMVSGGSALRIEWGAEGEDSSGITEHLMDVSVLEHVVLQYWQLVTLDRRTSHAASDAKSLAAAQLELALGLDEYERAFISYQSAQLIADRLQDELRLNRLFDRLSRRIETLASAMASQEQKIAQRRGIALAALAVLATAAFALPSLEQSIRMVVTTYPTLGDGPDGRSVSQAAIYVFVAIIIALLVTAVFVLRTARGRRRRRKAKEEFGQEWAGGGMRVSLAMGTSTLSGVPTTRTEAGKGDTGSSDEVT